MDKLLLLGMTATFGLAMGCVVESTNDDDIETETDSSTGGGPGTATSGESESGTTAATSGSGGEGDTGETSASSGSAGDTTGSPGEQVGSCYDDPLTQCLDYTGSGYVPEAFPMGCPNIFSEDPCPSEGVVFSCLFFADDPLESIGRYYSPWSSKGAAQDCEQASGVPL